jgi:hypothetical protein
MIQNLAHLVLIVALVVRCSLSTYSDCHFLSRNVNYIYIYIYPSHLVKAHLTGKSPLVQQEAGDSVPVEWEAVSTSAHKYNVLGAAEYLRQQ